MKGLISTLLIAFSAIFSVSGQVQNPVKWSRDYVLDGDQHALLRFTATIEPGWHVYSTTVDPNAGPIPTSFDFMKVEGAELAGSLKEPTPHVEFDPNFQTELAWFEDKVTFEQRIKLTGPRATVTGEYTFMACDDKMCLPPDYVEFSFDIEAAIKPSAQAEGQTGVRLQEHQKGSGPEADMEPEPIAPLADEEEEPSGIVNPVSWTYDVTKTGDDIYTISATATIDEGWHVYSKDLPDEDGPVATSFSVKEGDFELSGDLRESGGREEAFDPNFQMDLVYFGHTMTLEQDIKVTGTSLVRGALEFMACNDVTCTTPKEVGFSFDPATEKIALADPPEDDTEEETAEGNMEEAAEDSDSDEASDIGFWALFFLGFGGGLLALLTPCVFPMIPLTVSFFTKQSKTRAKGIRNGIIYGLSIVILYTAIGVLVILLFGKDSLHELSTNTYFNLFLFALLVVFAISFFGAFEITLPSALANKLDRASDRQGLIGIFFMAATLTVVSFSCTGPILGSAISLGDPAQLTTTMFGFSVALGLPFALFAVFPGWLNSLPQSGGWLNSVKVSLGFVELAFAFKFLSNADLVEQWHLLEREVFIAIWVACSLLLTLYLLGFITMPHDSKIERLSVTRAMFAVASLVFTLYLIPGLWGAPLKLISGFPPPDFYAEQPYGLYGQSGGGGGHGNDHAVVDDNGCNGDGGHCPKNLGCYHDYEAGMACAKETGKPVMLDFTGWACVNCRKMEEQVWSDPRVWDRLNEDFVLVSLYVDEQSKLPENERFYSEAIEKEVTRVGQKWVDFEISRFNHNTQPLYAIIDHDGKPVHETASYDPDIEKFIEWLDRGKKLFEEH